jgi:hypothetical protein
MHKASLHILFPFKVVGVYMVLVIDIFNFENLTEPYSNKVDQIFIPTAALFSITLKYFQCLVIL